MDVKPCVNTGSLGKIIFAKGTKLSIHASKFTCLINPIIATSSELYVYIFFVCVCVWALTLEKVL